MYKAVESIAELKAHWAEHGSLENVVVKALDLRGETDFLLQADAHCAVFLGARMEDDALDHVIGTGGIVFPRLRELLELPFEVYRDRLYSLPELMNGLDVERPGSLFEDSVDGKIYRWFQSRRGGEEPASILDALAQRLHDHAIEDAMREFLDARPPDVVAIMGGHALHRSDPRYREVGELGRALARKGWLVVTGGGPGAMEAGNLGAWLAPHPDEALGRAVELLSPSPGFHDDPEQYLGFGYRVLAELSLDPDSPTDGRGGESLAIPTWYYGHEPSNQFATHIAKYFANSAREAGLVTVANRGIVFAPGAAGTIQEIFMDATQNYYVTEGVVSPMVLLGSDYWRGTLPVAPLLEKLAADREMAKLVTVVDTVDEAIRFLVTRRAP